MHYVNWNLLKSAAFLPLVLEGIRGVLQLCFTFVSRQEEVDQWCL